MTVRTPLVIIGGQVAQLPAGDTISGAGGVPAPTQVGQMLVSVDGASFAAALPLTSTSAGWLVNDQGYLLVVG